MYPLRIVLSSMLLALLLAGPSRPAYAGSAAAPSAMGSPEAGPGDPRTYLPLVIRTSAQSLSSNDLIDQAIASGQLSAEQGLIYKVYAQFSDARLPARYIGTGTGRRGDLVMAEVASQAATLSDTAKQLLTPFFVPPNDPRSWYYLPHLGEAPVRAQADPGSWQFKPAAGGKVRVFYYSTLAGDAAKATQIAAEFDARIWSKLTDLMQMTPLPNIEGATDIYLWDSYIRNNGTVVPFSATTLGITVGASCDETSVTIYLPSSLPVGSATSPGLIQYATHEFMHAIQFGQTIQSCPKYRWLKEATATWAEDYVYPQANSEQETASGYFDSPSARLDSAAGLHDYGAYLLFYFLTHKVDTSAAVVRHAWQNAATEANSYMAMDKAVEQAAPSLGGDVTWRDLYWPLFLDTLWNKAPFRTYYATSDGLSASVARAGGSAIRIAAAGGEQITPLNAEIPTGGALFFHLTFPDTSVRSLTILNGLGYELSTGAASTFESTDGDQAYQTEELPSEDLQGAVVQLLLKARGQDAYPAPSPLTSNLANLAQADYCLDVQGAMEEIVVILSNADFAHPDRIMKAKDLPVTVWANNVPCWKVTGTAKAIDYDNGVTTEAEGTVTFGWPSAIPDPQPYMNLAQAVYPEVSLRVLSAQATWKVSGTDSGGCTYSGSGSYTADEAANDYLNIEQGLLAGGPTYRGYSGSAGPMSELDDTYHVQCESYSYDSAIGGFGFLSIPLAECRSQIKVDAAGNMNGSCKIPNYEGRYQQYEWHLSGERK